MRYVHTPTVGWHLTACQTPYPVVSHGIPISISPHPNGSRVDFVVHLVMSNNRPELGSPSTVSAPSSIVIDGTSQGESGGNSQLQRAELLPLATDFPNRSQYTPPYTPGGSHAESTTFLLREVAPVESDVEILCPQFEVQASKGRALDNGAGFPQSTAPPSQMDTLRTRKARDANPVENAVESQPKDWNARQVHQRRIETSPSVHGSRSRTRSPAHSPTKGNSPAVETRSRTDYSRDSQHREVSYVSYRHNGNHESYYSPDGCLMRGLSSDPVHRAASKRGRSPSPKSLVGDHEQVADRLDHDVSITRTNHVRSQSSSSISGIESRRESLSRSRSRDVVSSQVHPRRGYTPPRMDTQPQSQWTRPASPVNTADTSHHEENETLLVTRVGGRGSLASRLDISCSQKKVSTPTMLHSEARVPITGSPPPYRFGKVRSENYGTDGRQTRRRLQDRIGGNQTGTFGSKFGLRCPYSHRVQGANDCHDKNEPHPGYTSDEWRVIMEYVQRFGYAPHHLTKGDCVYHPSFKPPESSQPRNHPLNTFSITAQGTDRYIPPPTPPVPQQPPMVIPYPPMPVPMPTPSFSSGPLSHSYPLRSAHIGASHVNHFDTLGSFEARPAFKKRKTGPQGQFRPASGDHGSQQAQSYQWPPHSMPPPNWSQQPPSDHPPVQIGRPRYTRQAHRPNTFHNQQGQAPLPHPTLRKRTYDQR